jgi:hypothetical protein
MSVLRLIFVLSRSAQPRSEATMQANYFNTLSTVAFFQGQGSQNAVESVHRTGLRALAAKLASIFSRGFSLSHGLWQAHLLKRLPAMATPAMCPMISDRRRQRVVVTRGTVGVC